MWVGLETSPCSFKEMLYQTCYEWILDFWSRWVFSAVNFWWSESTGDLINATSRNLCDPNLAAAGTGLKRHDSSLEIKVIISRRAKHMWNHLVKETTRQLDIYIETTWKFWNNIGINCESSFHWDLASPMEYHPINSGMLMFQF